MKPWRQVLLVPILTWVGLLAALAATLAYAFWPAGPLKPVAALAVAACKAGLIAVFFMRLKAASPLVRLTAVVGLLWLSILFILGFADVLTRLPTSGS